MDDLEIRRLQMFTRVRDYGVTNSESFPTSSLGGELFGNIASIVSELSSHAAVQAARTGLAREETTNKAALRDELRDILIDISATARAIAVTIPGFDDKFSVPRNDNDQLLLNAARAFAENAAPFTSEFGRHEMAPDFFDGLNNTIKLFEKASGDQNLDMETRMGATEDCETVECHCEE
jgi:hypothetical protein